MVVLTQLIYLHPGKHEVFEEFERHALALLAKHRGELLLRLRPTPESVIASQIEVPYEIHLVRFESADDFAQFTQDDERQRFLHLKDEAVRASWLVQGTPL
jgi:hypothetical protein